MDKEIFSCDEYKTVTEYKKFPAEEYRSKEILNNAKEEYKVEEFLKSSKTESANSENKSALGKISNLQPATSLSVSASASVGATGAFVGVITVGVAVTLGIVPLTAEPLPEPVNFGSLTYINYRLDYIDEESSDGLYADITFNFEGDLKSGFNCVAYDVLTEQSAPLTDNKITFENVRTEGREFRIEIQKDTEVIETKTVQIVDYYVFDNTPSFEYFYKVTYNQDNTSNLFTYFKSDYDGEFVTYINLYDENFVAADYETKIDGAISGILNIKEEIYTARFVSYYVKDNNYYSYCSSDKISIGYATLEWAASVTDDKLTLSFGNDVLGSIDVVVTHDDLSCEEFNLNADELVDNTYEITLSSISRNLTVEIRAEACLYDFDPSGYLSECIGVDYREVVDCLNVTAFVSSTVSLTRFEIYNASYNYDYGDTIHAPVYLYFDGFLNEGDTYSVKVIDSDGGEVEYVTGLTLSDKPLTFLELLADTEYTFMFYLTANGEETLSGSITRTLSVLEFPDLPQYFCVSPNPGDAMVTYNEGGTSNVYLYMNVQETEYDMYYKVYLVDVTYEDGSVFFEYSGKDNVAVLRNIPAGTYAIKYGVLINDGDTCYSVYNMVWPSGTIVTGLDEGGYYPDVNCGNANYNSDNKTLSINVYGKITGDVNIKFTFDDGQQAEMTIPLENVSADYSTSVLSADLSGYEFTSFKAVIEGVAIFQYGKGDIIKSEVEITESESCPFKIEYSNN